MSAIMRTGLCLGLFISSIILGAQPITHLTFDSPQNITTGLHPNAVVIVDLDGDGKTDLATANNHIDGSAASISVLRNTSSSGSISFAPKTDLPTGIQALHIATGDLNGDGKPDLAVTSGANQLSIFRNTSTPGNISFASRIDYASENTPFGIAISDLNVDGRPDIVLTSYTTGWVSVYANTGSSGAISFASPLKMLSAPGPYYVAAGDLDGDGRPDLAISNELSNSVSVFRNTSGTGSISFAARTDIPVDSRPRGIIIHDLDVDGKPDVAIVHNGSTILRMLRNTSSTGSISFFPYAAVVGPDGYNLAAKDLNNDGLPELVVSAYGKTSLLQNFSTPGSNIHLAVQGEVQGYSHYFPVLGDLDGDSRPDMAVTNFNSNTIWCYRNRITEPAIGNIDPYTAGAGETVYIFGVNLTDVTAVSFGGVPAASFTIETDDFISATVGQGASGAVSVTAPTGSSSVEGFTFKTPPTLTSFTPAAAGEGTEVIIVGKGLWNIQSVTFGGVEARYIYHDGDDTSDSLFVGVGAGATGSIAVTNEWGTSTLPGFTFIPRPTITSYSPKNAGEGTVVTINGTNFTSATAVTFGNMPAASFVLNSSTSITAVVGTGATGYIAVTTPGGTAYADNFTYFGKPEVTSFYPDTGAEGTRITIWGSNFFSFPTSAPLDVLSVSFGGVPASDINILSTEELIVTVGKGASGDVTITTPGGTAVLSGFTFIPPPVITSFTPTTAGEGDVVTITGNNFTHVESVSFGRVGCTYEVVSETTILAKVSNGRSGNVDIVTFGGTSSLEGFTHTGPIVTSFSPNVIGSETAVTITGINFTDVTQVYFASTPAASFTVNSPTSITAFASEETNMVGQITVATVRGVDDSESFFEFYNPPVIVSFTPTMGGKGTEVFISGYDLPAPGGTVSFGGVPGTIVSIEYDVAKVIVGDGASGDVTFTTDFGTFSMPGFTFVEAPTITSFIPASGSTGTEVTITGSNLDLTTAVSFGGQPARTFTVVSPTEINAIVNGGASGSIEVTSPGGVASLDDFEFFDPAFIPSITSFQPKAAAEGDIITITGAQFTGATAVRVGGVTVPAFTVVSPTTITATIGTGASGSVEVTTHTGKATAYGFIYRNNTITGNEPSAHNEDETLTLSPNPMDASVLVRHPASSASAELQWIDMTGRKATIVPVQKGHTTTEVNVAPLTPGIYFVIWSDGKRKIRSKAFVY